MRIWDVKSNDTTILCSDFLRWVKQLAMDRSLPQRCSNWSSVPSLTRNLFMASDLAQMDTYGLIICRKDQLFNWLSEFKARAMKRSPGMAYIGTQIQNSTQGSPKSMLFLIIQRPPHFGIYIYIEYEICCILGANKFHVTPQQFFPPNAVGPQVLGRGCCPWVFQHQSSKELAGYPPNPPWVEWFTPRF